MPKLTPTYRQLIEAVCAKFGENILQSGFKIPKNTQFYITTAEDDKITIRIKTMEDDSSTSTEAETTRFSSSEDDAEDDKLSTEVETVESSVSEDDMEEDDSTKEEIFTLPQSLIYDPYTKQWCVIKPHTEQEKKIRLASKKNRGMQLSTLIQVDLDKPIPAEPLYYPYTQTERTVSTEEKAREIAEFTTLSFQAALGNDTKLHAGYMVSSIFTRFGIFRTKTVVIADFVSGVALPELKLNLSETIECTLEILQAVMSLHEKGIIHGDLKPEHFIKEWIRRRFVTIDLENAGRIHTDGNGKLLSTIYAAPERFSAHKMEPYIDAFSMGIIISFLYKIHHLFYERGHKLESMLDILHRKLMVLELINAALEPKKYEELKEECKELKKECEQLIHAVPKLEYNALESIKKAFIYELHNPKLRTIRLSKQEFSRKIDVLFRKIIDVINQLTEKEIAKRMTLQQAYSSFIEINQLFIVLFHSPQNHKYQEMLATYYPWALQNSSPMDSEEENKRPRQESSQEQRKVESPAKVRKAEWEKEAANPTTHFSKTLPYCYP